MSASISSAMIPPEANASEQSRMEFQARLAGLGGLHGKNVSPEAKAKKLREACEGFESIFIQKMWQEMRNAIPKSGLMHGKEERFWQDMYDQELAKSMSKAGGIGLADMMFEQLSRNLGAASRGTAGMEAAPAFAPAAAPLLPTPAAASIETAEPEPAALARAEAPAPKPGAIPSIYDGGAPETGEVKGEESAQKSGAQAASKPEQAAPVQTAAVQPAPQAVAQAAVAAVQPAPAAQARPERMEKPERVVRHIHAPGSREYSPQENVANGIELAQIARRDAGDKLGSRGIRPARQRKRRETAEEAGAREAMLAQAAQQGQGAQAGGFRPGTPEALAAALAQARNAGQPGQSSGGSGLESIVAAAQARNAANVQPVAGRAQEPAQAVARLSGEEAPKVRKVRFSTNIPNNEKVKKGSRKAARDAIRLLNVDNVGVNSKAGQGLAAYHAAKEAEQAPQARVEQAAGAVQPAQVKQEPAQAIAPLTAAQASKAPEPEGASFAIPPLTARSL